MCVTALFRTKTALSDKPGWRFYIPKTRPELGPREDQFGIGFREESNIAFRISRETANYKLQRLENKDSLSFWRQWNKFETLMGPARSFLPLPLKPLLRTLIPWVRRVLLNSAVDLCSNEQLLYFSFWEDTVKNAQKESKVHKLLLLLLFTEYLFTFCQKCFFVVNWKTKKKQEYKKFLTWYGH